MALFNHIINVTQLFGACFHSNSVFRRKILGRYSIPIWLIQFLITFLFEERYNETLFFKCNLFLYLLNVLKFSCWEPDSQTPYCSWNVHWQQSYALDAGMLCMQNDDSRANCKQ